MKLIKNYSINKIIIYTVSIISIFVLFISLSFIINNEVIFPSIITVFNSFFSLISKTKTYLIIIYSISRLTFALIVGFFLAFILALLATKYKSIHIFLRPYFYILRSIPFVAILLIIMVLTSINDTPVILTTLIIIPILYDSIYYGMTNIDQNLNNVWLLDTKINYKVMSKILIPLSWPNIKVGLITAISTGIKLIIMAEFICGTPNSIGNSLISAANNFDYALVFAWTILIIFIVLLLNSLAKFLKRN